MDEFEKWWNSPQGFASLNADGDGIAETSFVAGFRAGREQGMREASEICKHKVQREPGYGGQFEGYGYWMGDQTGPECAAAILAAIGEGK